MKKSELKQLIKEIIITEYKKAEYDKIMKDLPESIKSIDTTEYIDNKKILSDLEFAVERFKNAGL